MKSLTLAILSLSLLTHYSLSAEQLQRKCNCQNCQCQLHSHCGCYSDKGCACNQQHSCGMKTADEAIE